MNSPPSEIREGPTENPPPTPRSTRRQLSHPLRRGYLIKSPTRHARRARTALRPYAARPLAGRMAKDSEGPPRTPSERGWTQPIERRRERSLPLSRTPTPIAMPPLVKPARLPRRRQRLLDTRTANRIPVRSTAPSNTQSVLRFTDGRRSGPLAVPGLRFRSSRMSNTFRCGSRPGFAIGPACRPGLEQGPQAREVIATT
jgi:hypothetical protein